MGYLRDNLKQEYYGPKSSTHPDLCKLIKVKGIYFTKPTEIKYEKYCFERYFLIINKLIEKFEKNSTLKNDLNLLKNKDLPRNKRMAILYRSEKKAILKN